MEETHEEEELLVNQLMKFRKQSKLKRTALLAVSFVTTGDELRQLTQAFLEIDTNGDGLISPEEFKTMMAKHGVADDAEVTALFDAMDQDSTGLIKFSEFIAAAMEEQSYAATERIEAAFRRLDLDDSGQITVENLTALIGETCDPEQVKQILSEADYEHNGVIDLAEFRRAMDEEPM